MGRWSRKKIVTGLCDSSGTKKSLEWMCNTQEGFLEEVVSKLRLEGG